MRLHVAHRNPDSFLCSTISATLNLTLCLYLSGGLLHFQAPSHVSSRKKERRKTIHYPLSEFHSQNHVLRLLLLWRLRKALQIASITSVVVADKVRRAELWANVQEIQVSLGNGTSTVTWVVVEADGVFLRVLREQHHHQCNVCPCACSDGTIYYSCILILSHGFELIPNFLEARILPYFLLSNDA